MQKTPTWEEPSLSILQNLSETEICRFLTGQAIGVRMEIHDEIESTNNRARELAESGAPHGFMVLADSQSKGRGRQGRSFFSPKGTGVYVSYILRLAVPLAQVLRVTPLAAVAAARAIETVADVQVGIKWVNDLFLHDRKVSGILCEASSRLCSAIPDYLILGIGVNSGPIMFPPELQNIATSVGNECGKPVDRNRLIAEISNQLDALLPQLETGTFMKEYRERSNVIGRMVTVAAGASEYQARVLNIDEEGRLVLQKDKEIITLNSGEIRIRRQT